MFRKIFILAVIFIAIQSLNAQTGLALLITN
jgi:hypothetical protein